MTSSPSPGSPSLALKLHAQLLLQAKAESSHPAWDGGRAQDQDPGTCFQSQPRSQLPRPPLLPSSVSSAEHKPSRPACCCPGPRPSSGFPAQPGWGQGLTSPQGSTLQAAQRCRLQACVTGGFPGRPAHAASSAASWPPAPSDKTQWTERDWEPPPQEAEQGAHGPAFQLVRTGIG